MHAPYGTFPVDESVRRRYNTSFAYAYHVPLPTTLPLHHPILEDLSQRTPLSDAPGPWWPDCVAGCHQEFQDLLLSVSAQEYRSGNIEDQRWRAFRAAHADRDFHSPDVGRLLQFTGKRPRMEPTWNMLWKERGPKDTPLDMDLVISTRPEWWLNMSNGRGWDSCMNIYRRNESYNLHLPGNFYDLGAAIALLLPHGKDIWTRKVVIARTTLHLQHIPYQQGQILTIGECYHNNRTAAQWLILTLIRTLEKKNISWGFITGTHSAAFWHEGHLGGELQEQPSETLTARSEPMYLPPGGHYRPYMDGNACWIDEQTDWSILKSSVSVPDNWSSFKKNNVGKLATHV
jgi:hypothetical protein